MQKQQLIGIVLISLLVALYMGYVMPKYYTPPPPKATDKSMVATDTTKGAASPSVTVALDSTTLTKSNDTTSSAAVTPEQLIQQAKEIVIDTDLYRARISSLGGRLVSFKLKQIATDKLPSKADEAAELKAAQESGDKLRIQMAQTRMDKILLQETLEIKVKYAREAKDPTAEQYSQQLKEMNWVELINSDNHLPHPLQIDITGVPKVDETTLYTVSADTIILNKSTPTGNLVLTGTTGNGVVIEKTLGFLNNNYLINYGIKIKNTSPVMYKLGPDMGTGMKVYVGSGLGDLQLHAQSRYDMGIQGVSKVNNKTAIIKLNAKQMENHLAGNVSWAGIESNYFFKGFVPSLCTTTSVGALYSKMGESFSPTVWIEVPSQDIASQSEKNVAFQFYIGPKQLEQLKALNASPEEILFPGWLQTINLWLLYLLKWGYQLTKNYGIAVILLAVLLKVVTFPLNHISYKSMKRMQILQPEMKALQEKYKDDPTRQQKELMELYRKHKVNPMSGCLPMIVQMPIFFSLYQVLGKVVELRGAPFYGWITDLSKPDTIMVVMGISINILPLLMGVTMWVQQKMTTTPDPKSAMMGQMMTLVFIFIFWNMPSGLVLYWFITNILSILQQHYINKQEIPIHMPHAEAAK